MLEKKFTRALRIFRTFRRVRCQSTEWRARQQITSCARRTTDSTSRRSPRHFARHAAWRVFGQAMEVEVVVLYQFTSRKYPAGKYAIAAINNKLAEQHKQQQL